MNPKTQNHPTSAQEAPTYIIVSVEFGQRLPNGNCGHIGICSTGDATLPGSAALPRERRCRRAMAQVTAGKDGRAIFFFPRDKMLPCTARAFFRGSTFHVPVSYELPVQWQDELPNLQTFTLEAGHYIVEKYEAGFLIRF